MSVTRITQGPLSTTGINPFDQQSVVLDVVNNIMETSGNSHLLAACQTAIAVIGPQTALTSITTAQNLISKVLGAGMLNKLNRTVLVEGSLIYTSPGTTTPTFSIAVTLGGVTLCTITTAAISSTASTNMPIQFSFMFNTSAVGSAGTIETHGTVSANITANTPAAAVAAYSDTNTAASSAINLTTALTLLVTIAASSIITSAQLRLASINVLF